MAEHRSKFGDHGNRVWRLINFELRRGAIDGEPAEAVATSWVPRTVVQV